MVSSTAITLASDSQLSGLTANFKNLVSSTMGAEKNKKIDPLNVQKDALAVRKSMYTDVKGMLDGIRTQLRTLLSTDSAFTLGTNTTKSFVSNTPDSSTVLSAITDSTAAPATYNFSDISLATTNRVMSDRHPTSDSGLATSGPMVINGTSIAVNISDTLISIAAKINSASYETDLEVSASVVDNHLVLEAKTSGADGQMTLSGGPFVDLGILNEDGSIVTGKELSAGKDGSMNINGVPVTFTKNTELSTIITGVTINLANDAEGESATLTVQTNTESLQSQVGSFITKYNAAVDYLQKKSASTKVNDTQYTRGALADDHAMRYLPNEMNSLLASSYSAGNIKTLAEIGITFNDKMQLTVSDSTKLSDALVNDMDDVQALLDNKMGSLNDKLDMYLDTDKGILNYTMSSIESQSKQLQTTITRQTDMLNAQQLRMIQEYSSWQDQLAKITNDQQVFAAYYQAGLYGSGSSS